VTFLKELRKDKENAHRVINYVTDFLIEYAKLMIENGVDFVLNFVIGSFKGNGQLIVVNFTQESLNGAIVQSKYIFEYNILFFISSARSVSSTSKVSIMYFRFLCQRYSKYQLSPAHHRQR